MKAPTAPPPVKRMPRAVEINDFSFPSTTTARAKRHFEETGRYLVVQTWGHHVVDFIETHCVFTESHYAGQPFRLMPWQVQFIYELFEVKLVKGRWLRVHRWGMLGVPKKNGKTELAAAIGNYLAVDDDEASARVICAAASDEQAGLLFTAASRMCDWSETLSKFSEVLDKGITFHTSTATSELKRVAAAAGTNDGKNVHAVLIDEFHEWVLPKHRSVFVVLTQGGGARQQPINIIITTAGSDQDSTCYEYYERGHLMMSGELDDPTFYFCWFEPPPNSDYRDPLTWELANPSWGLILQEDFYADIITKRSESEFCRYFLNMWMEADEIWEAAQHWDALEADAVLRPELPTYVGIDVGRRHDSCAVIACQWDGERVLVRTKFWRNPYKRADTRHGQWALTIAEVESYCKELYEEFPEPAIVDEEDGYRIPGPSFAYDPHFFVRSAELLEGEGLSMVEFPQSDSKMVPASQLLFELIKTKALAHDGSAILRSHIRAVQAKEKERGWRIARPEGSTKHIDGAVALAMAAYTCAGEFQPYDEPPNLF